MKYLKTVCVLLLIMIGFCVNAYADTFVPILLYHNVLESYPEKDSIVTITPQRLDEHIKALLDNGYTPISFNDYQSAVNGTGMLPDKPVIITFDDGYETNYTYAYPIFKKYNIKATIFVTAKHVGQTPGNLPHFNWEQAKEMQQSGLVSIQSHTYSHTDMTSLDTYTAEREMRYSKYLIEKNLGTVCNVLAFPYGFNNPDLINKAHRAGYNTTVQVGNFGTNTVKDADNALIRITVYGSWTDRDLLRNISNYHR